MDYDLIIIAGEPSGDQHAAEVLKKLKSTHPNLKIAGVCGPSMKAAYEIVEIVNINKLSIMGFVDVLLNLPKLFFIYHKILRFLLDNRSKAVLFVDYPGMNLKLGKKLRQSGYQGKIFQYIAPTAWAWKKNRVKTLSYYCDKLFCILPFEQQFFKTHNVDAIYVGNPLVQKLKHYMNKKDTEAQLIAIFPGSRVHEIYKNLPLILDSCWEIKKQHPQMKFGLSLARPELEEHIFKILKLHPLNTAISIWSHALTIDLMLKAQLAIAKSGTCILELALLGTPTIVTYAISKLDIFIATKIFKIKLPYYSLPNLILNKELFKELYGPFFSKTSLIDAINNSLTSSKISKQRLEELRQTLGSSDPSEQVANFIKLAL